MHHAICPSSHELSAILAALDGTQQLDDPLPNATYCCKCMCHSLYGNSGHKLCSVILLMPSVAKIVNCLLLLGRANHSCDGCSHCNCQLRRRTCSLEAAGCHCKLPFSLQGCYAPQCCVPNQSIQRLTSFAIKVWGKELAVAGTDRDL